MRGRGWSAVGLLIPALWIAAPNPGFAQVQVTTTPESLTVSGIRGTTETRTVLIQTSQPVSAVTITPLDLDRTDGASVFPAASIQVAEPVNQNQVAIDKTLSLPLQFTLDRSGEFSGSLLLTYEGGQRVVPITAKVKDAPWLPLLLLLGGVGLGVWLSVYRSEGKFYDESVVRVGQLRTQMRSDDQLAKSFAAKIEADLIDVETALSNKQFDLAQQAVTQAQVTWNKWRKGRNDWIAQLEYQKTLTARLTDLDADTPYEQAVRARLDDAIREAVNQESPAQLRSALQPVRQQINRYLQGKARLDELDGLRDKLSADRSEGWRQEIKQLERQLNQLSPDSPEAFEQWLATVKSVRQQMVAELEGMASRGAEASPAGAREIDITSSGQYVAPVPSAQPFADEKKVKASGQRLWIGNVLSYSILIMLLSVAGFNQLYISNPTFGASLGDYLTLLAWGFGAEATSESIAKVMQRWGLPGNR